MEPEVLTMGRNIQSAVKAPKQRCPGDGMESSLLLNATPKPYSTITTNYPTTKSLKKLSPFNKPLDVSLLNEVVHEHSKQDVMIDGLHTQLTYLREHNDQLIEEKMKISHQLSTQTQVNNELKNLLVASIGDDLGAKYERMILDRTQSDMELNHLRNVLEEDREEVEHAIIQADVWRSKFLASRVMGEELTRWKSALYYKYRESHTALQSLLEEHSKIRALNNATKKGLVRLAELLKCKDPSLDSNSPMTLVDVAFTNHDLVEAFVEVLQESDNVKLVEIKNTEKARFTGGCLKTEFDVEACELSFAEQLAHEVVLNTSIQTEELLRMRKDYLAHNRISHFLSTNYQVTFNCCESCKGKMKHL